MITFEAKWYDGKRSAQRAVVVTAYDNGAIQVELSGSGDIVFRQSRFVGRVSDRLADTARCITFPSGAILETDDNAAVDQLLRKTKKDSWTRWIHLLESKKRYVLTAALLVVLIGMGMVRFAIPQAARVIAAALPNRFFEAADRQTLAVLDHTMFKPSKLAADAENRVRSHLQSAIDDHAAQNIRLLFRKGGQLGPNAFALPGGTIVFTDELIDLAAHADELLGIMAHEIGHVVHQHAMRRMVQDSLLSFAILSLTGDASGVSELFLGLPVVLTGLAYSRDFERDADQYALAYLQSHDIPPSRFADILTRIADKFEEQDPGAEARRWTGYLSTHPPTPDRVRAFRQAGGGAHSGQD